MFSPSRVVAQLAGYFPPDFSTPKRREIAIADAFKRILQDAIYADIDCDEEEQLQVSLDETEDVEWIPEDDSDGGHVVDSRQKSIVLDGRQITDNMLAEAVEHYRQTSKRSRGLKSMTNQFRWIKTKHHLELLRTFEKSNQLKQNRVMSFKRLSAALQERCMEAIQKGLPLSYSTLRHVALTINRDHGFVHGFKASKDWISKFVRGCGLRSKKMTSFVTTRNLRERQRVEDATAAFVEDVKAEMANHPHSIFCNID